MSSLTVVIPTFNRISQLRNSLLSVSNLENEIEIIVGNNGVAEPVQDLIKELKLSADCRILQNPAGSTYPYNLSVLVAAASGEWLTILHDDDFFTPEAKSVLPALLSANDIDFLFSDHYIADALGNILFDLSLLNSRRCGREDLESGPVGNLQLLVVNNSIALDCFFVRTRLAQQCYIDTTLSCFADVLFLAQIAMLSKGPVYFSDRLFVYRLNEGLTSAELLHDELLFVLQRCRDFIINFGAAVALEKRIRKQAWYSLRYSLKRRKFKAVAAALSALAFFRN